MNKIIILFLLFSFSLFGDIQEHKYGFTIAIKDQYDFGYTLFLDAFRVKEKIKPSLIFSFNAKYKTKTMNFNGSQIRFENQNFVFAFIDEVAYISNKDIELSTFEIDKYTYININNTDLKLPTFKIKDKFHIISIQNQLWIKQILKEITEKRFFIVFENEAGAFFDLTKYKYEILNSDFYINLAN